MLKSRNLNQRCSEHILSLFDVRVRNNRWLSRSIGTTWDWSQWSSAKAGIIAGRLWISDANTTWQLSPLWVALHGFKKIAVYGVDDEGRRQGLVVKFADVGDSWKLAESIPGLRWTYWDPKGQLEAIPVKIKKYRRPHETALSALIVVATLGFFLWISFYSPLGGFVGFFSISFVSLFHLLLAPFSQTRQKQKKGNLLAEAGNVVLTAGNIVWFRLALSDRKTRNPERLVVTAGGKNLLVEFESEGQAMNGSKLIGRNLHGLQGLVDLAQAA